MLEFTSALFIVFLAFLFGFNIIIFSKFLVCKLKYLWSKFTQARSKGTSKKTTAPDLLDALRACDHTHSGEGISIEQKINEEWSCTITPLGEGVTRKDLSLKDVQCHPLISEERAEEFKNSTLPTATLIGHITTGSGFTGINARTIFGTDLVRYILGMYGTVTEENVEGTRVFKFDTKNVFNEYSLYHEFECILNGLGIKNIAFSAAKYSDVLEVWKAIDPYIKINSSYSL